MSSSEVASAIEAAASNAELILVLVEAPDGLAGSFLDLFPEDLPVVRVSGAPATQGQVGGVAESIDLDELEMGILVVENAQWVDPSSIGRIQRLLSGDEVTLAAVVVVHMPVEPHQRWWIDTLAAAGERHGTVLWATIDTPALKVEPPTDESELDLVLASRLVADAIPVAVVAQFLGISQSEALELAERLIQDGLLDETRLGVRCSEAGRAVRAGEARLGHVAGRLADAFERSGAAQGVVGSLYLSAGNHGEAYPRLRNAAISVQDRARGEAYHLATAALAAAEAASVGTREELGTLHLICGRHLRTAGRPEAAAEHLDEAVGLLEGPARIDALGFAAAVADDRQHPQEAERILAVAEWEAAVQGEIAKLGSLGTFRARALNRIGFADEADAAMAKAEIRLAEHASPVQQYFATLNHAWMSFDRGHMTQAESLFTRLRDLTDEADDAGLADMEAWRARSLFASGQPGAAMSAVAKARELAAIAGVEAPIFLSDLALAEGGLLFGRPAMALEAADRVWDLVERQLPGWANVAHANRALSLMRLGRTSEAASEIEAALEVTPSGADGWRWRSRCRAIQMEITAANKEPFPQREAEDLADVFLQSEYHGWAAELLCVVAEQTKGKEAAMESMALANQIGNPMLAARAASAGSLWEEPAAAATIRAIRSMEHRLPEGWAEDWKKIVAVAEALAAIEPAGDEAGDDNARIVQQALERAGLASSESILSPAQRRHLGLVSHRGRRRRPLALVAAAIGVVVLTVGTSLAVAQLTQPEAPPDTAVVAEPLAPTTTVEPTLEATQVDVPVDLLFGRAPDRGDSGRSGYFDVAGPRTVDGHYWVFQAADAITATPLVYGNNLLVGSADGIFQAIDLTEGTSAWSLLTEDQIDASAGLPTGAAPVSDGGTPVGEASPGDSGTVVVVGDDGVVRARDALVVTASQIWSTALGATIKSSPIVSGRMVYVATTEGFVYAIDLANGEVDWRYPAEGEEPLGRVTADLTLADDIIYVGSEAGDLHLVRTDGTLVCESTVDAPITVNPVVVDGRAYISYGQVLRIMDAGLCVDQVLTSDAVQYLSETVIDVAPAVVGDLMYIPNAQFLNAVDRTAIEEGVSSPGEAHHWSEGKVHADGKIASPPVVTRDAVYFGTTTGRVYAVDSDTGDLLWEWQTGNYVRASPAVIDGAIFIASGDGRIYAVGPGD